MNNHKIFWNKNLHQINLWVKHEKSQNKNLQHKNLQKNLPKIMKMYKTKNVPKLKFSKFQISNLKLKIFKLKISKLKISILEISKLNIWK